MEGIMMRVELNKEEFEAMQKDLIAVLEKHNCELGVKAQIEIMKVVPQPPAIPYVDPDGESSAPEETKAD